MRDFFLLPSFPKSGANQKKRQKKLHVSNGVTVFLLSRKILPTFVVKLDPCVVKLDQCIFLKITPPKKKAHWRWPSNNLDVWTVWVRSFSDVGLGDSRPPFCETSLRIQGTGRISSDSSTCSVGISAIPKNGASWWLIRKKEPGGRSNIMTMKIGYIISYASIRGFRGRSKKLCMKIIRLYLVVDPLLRTEAVVINFPIPNEIFWWTTEGLQSSSFNRRYESSCCILSSHVCPPKNGKLGDYFFFCVSFMEVKDHQKYNKSRERDKKSLQPICNHPQATAEVAPKKLPVCFGSPKFWSVWASKFASKGITKRFTNPPIVKKIDNLWELGFVLCERLRPKCSW